MTDIEPEFEPEIDRIGGRPHDEAAEQAVLGAILTGHAMDDLGITAADFYQPRNADVWQAAAAVAATGRKPDPILIDYPDRLYLAELVGNVGVLANTKAHAKIVAAMSDRRWLMDLCLGGYTRATTVDPDKLAEDLRVRLDRRERRQRDLTHLGDIMPQLVDRIESGGTQGPSTPWPELDRYIHGLQPGRLYTVGARPGVGKSLVGQAMAWHMSKAHSRGVLVASLEMPEDEYGMRFLSAESGVAMRQLESGALTEYHWQRVASSTTRFGRSHVYLNDDSSQSVASIRSDARAVGRRSKLGLVVIDYLQLMAPSDRRVPRDQQIGQITRDLKRLAKDLRVPVVLLSQLNRESAKTGRAPTLTDLRESGDIEQDSDVVILLHRLDSDGHADPNMGVPIDALIEKNRSGPSHCRASLLVQGNLARVVERDDRATPTADPFWEPS